ncbi:MAG TPA: hypothetical protein VFZ42_02220 [Chitinophagaceae bacterium]
MESTEEHELHLQLAREWGINPAAADTSAFESILATRINQLINEDFNKLVSILYRLDIDENALRAQLDRNADDAGSIIAGMVIHRQLQKNKSRREFRQRDDNIDEAEKW